MGGDPPNPPLRAVSGCCRLPYPAAHADVLSLRVGRDRRARREPCAGVVQLGLRHGARHRHRRQPRRAAASSATRSPASSARIRPRTCWRSRLLPPTGTTLQAPPTPCLTGADCALSTCVGAAAPAKGTCSPVPTVVVPPCVAGAVGCTTRAIKLIVDPDSCNTSVVHFDTSNAGVVAAPRRRAGQPPQRREHRDHHGRLQHRHRDPHRDPHRHLPARRERSDAHHRDRAGVPRRPGGRAHAPRVLRGGGVHACARGRGPGSPARRRIHLAARGGRRPRPGELSLGRGRRSPRSIACAADIVPAGLRGARPGHHLRPGGHRLPARGAARDPHQPGPDAQRGAPPALRGRVLGARLPGAARHPGRRRPRHAGGSGAEPQWALTFMAPRLGTYQAVVAAAGGHAPSSRGR